MNTNYLEIALLLLLYGLVFLAIEQLQSRKLLDREWARKATHITGGFLVAILPIALTHMEIVGVMAFMALGMLISKRKNWLSSIHGVVRRTHGEVWFPVGIAILALSDPSLWRFEYGVLVLGVSDALASIFGQRYGKKKYAIPGGRFKTYFGSSVFFLSTLGIGWAGLVMGADQSIVASLLPATTVALGLTLIEAGSVLGIDNLLLPPLAALAMRLIAKA